ncbi:MAG: hypothetical protein HOH74_15525 [Gemmatimonadetes bacterium]|jgi:hypothetical protein|nr:hypothetical protein [Gemmatimonadota bacterium]
MMTYFGLFARSAGSTVFTVALVATTLLSGPRVALAETDQSSADPAHSATDAAFVQGDETDSNGQGGKRFLTMRRSLGVVFLAGSAIMVMQGFDLKDEADEFYDAYKSATDEAEIEKFYQRTTNRDVKSQVSWALAAAFGITGLRLALTGGDSGSDSMQVRAPTSAATDLGTGPSMSLAPAFSPRVVGLRLQRHFY